MKPAHAFLALFVAAIWGFNFVVIKAGLHAYPPLMLGCLRFLAAAVFTLFMRRPSGLNWSYLISAGALLFLGQTGFMFVAMYVGMPPGLASVVIQAQAFLTIFIAYFVLAEIPSRRQLAGATVAAGGLVVIAISIGNSSDGSLVSFALMLAAAASWAAANVLIRRGPKTDMVATMAWLSLVPPAPLLALSLYFEGNSALVALMHPTLLGLGSIGYLSAVVTLFGFGAWGHLLKLYPAGTVAPFATAVPIFGAASSALVFGEKFTAVDFLGMILVLFGLFLVTRSRSTKGRDPSRPETQLNPAER